MKSTPIGPIFRQARPWSDATHFLLIVFHSWMLEERSHFVVKTIKRNRWRGTSRSTAFKLRRLFEGFASTKFYFFILNLLKQFQLKLIKWGGRHRSVDSSAPTILLSRARTPLHTLTHTHYIVRNEKRTKINKKRPALIHILPISIKKAVVVSHLLERSLPTLENHSSNPVISNFY